MIVVHLFRPKAGSLVSQALKDHRVAIIDECPREAKEGIAQWQEAIMALQTDYMAAIDSRGNSLAGLRMLSNLGLTKDLAQFDNNFGIGGNFQAPSTHERQVLDFVALLERLFRPVDPERPKALHAKLDEYKAAAI